MSDIYVVDTELYEYIYTSIIVQDKALILNEWDIEALTKVQVLLVVLVSFGVILVGVFAQVKISF